MKNDKKVLLDTKEKFLLDESPDEWVVSLHIQNLMATYGEERVRDMIKVLFFENKSKKRKVS